MKLTADASIAVKWFVAEPLSEEARRLLAHRIHLHAPDILLAEFANTIWKKVHRREITDPQLYFDELVNLPEIVTLHLGRGLIERAAQLAVENRPSSLRLSLLGVRRSNGFGPSHGRSAIR